MAKQRSVVPDHPVTVVLPGVVGEPVIIDYRPAGLRFAVIERSGIGGLDDRWDAPGNYILLDPPNPDGSFEAYVGKAPMGLKSRLRSHVHGKQHWARAVLVVRDSYNGFHSAEVSWLEGRLYDMLQESALVTLSNRQRPRDETLPQYERDVLEFVVGPVTRVLSLIGHPVDGHPRPTPSGTTPQGRIPRARQGAVGESSPERVVDTAADSAVPAQTVPVGLTRETTDEFANHHSTAHGAPGLAGGEEQARRTEWWRRTTEATKPVLGAMVEILGEAAPGSTLKYNLEYITTIQDGSVNNGVLLRPRKTYLLVEFRLPDTARTTQFVSDAGFDTMPYESRWGFYRLRVRAEDLAIRRDSLVELVRLAYATTGTATPVIASERQRSYFGVTLQQVVASGHLQPGATLVSTNKTWPATATVNPDGTLTYNDATYASPSTAGRIAREGNATNGWDFWAVLEEGTQTTLSELRDRYLAELQP
jgi:hypothetical protein